MRLLISLAACALCAQAAIPAYAQDLDDAPAAQSSADEIDPQALALAREIVALGYPEAKRREMFFGMTDSLIGQLNTANLSELDDPELKQILLDKQAQMVVELKAIMDRHIPAIMDGMASAYATEFTLPELTAIRNFVATEEGSSFFQKSANVIGNPHYVQALQPYISELTQASKVWTRDMIATVQAYSQAHDASSDGEAQPGKAPRP